MQVLLSLLVRLCDFFCWLCSKRETAQTRLDAERLIDARKKDRKR